MIHCVASQRVPRTVRVATSRRARTSVRAAASGEEPSSSPALVIAAKRYAAALEEADEDQVTEEEELVARAAFDKESASEMSDVQRKYAAKIAAALQEVRACGGKGSAAG